jgi:hypothetical protein
MTGRALLAFSSSDQLPNKMRFMRRFVNQNLFAKRKEVMERDSEHGGCMSGGY